MPLLPAGRTAPFRGSVGLIACLVSAAAAAGLPLVAPDEAAGLRAVAEIEMVPGPAEGAHDTELWCTRLASTQADRSNADSEFGRPCGASACETHAPQWEADLLFSPEAGLPPVFRGQSPGIELLPLSTGATRVETTSLLRMLTGTKGRLRGDYLTDFDETDRIGVQTLTQAWFGFGLDAEVNYWQRPVAGMGREPLWTGDLNLIYSVVPHPRFKFRSGAGASWLVDDGEPHAGYNVTHGLDVYLLWRGMAIGEVDWGKMDNDNLFRYRLALGLTFDFCEVYSGYESYRLGGERLDGWVNGVAVWY